MALDPKKAIRVESRGKTGKKGVRRSTKRWIYFYQCIECGKEIGYTKDHLVERSGCCRSCASRISRPRPKGRPFGSLYSRVLKSASNRKLPCTLTYESFLKFTDVYKCHYCGSPILWSEYAGKGKSQAYNLDRKDNELGYTEDNVVVSCAICAWIKNRFLTYQDMMLLSPILKRIIPGKSRNAKSATANS
jgi:DNA-directed RNA polymerase subunit RPC12/RpoP